MAIIGVTGHHGFVGSHLWLALGRVEGTQLRGIDFREHDLSVPGPAIDSFVADLDVVFHLAGANRPKTPADFVTGNVDTTRNLLDAIERSGANPLVIYASTIHAELDNDYGRSKMAAEQLLEERADRLGLPLVILRIANVFGAGCRPFYNSVVATFCHQVALGEEPQVLNDAELSLASVNEVVSRLVELATTDRPKLNKVRETVAGSCTIRVSEIRDRLIAFREMRAKGVIPDFQSLFDRELYATLVSYIPPDEWALDLERHTDERGGLVEAFRFAQQGQVFFSTSRPGVVRGNHYHTRKTERFLVVEGNAIIRLRKLQAEKVKEFAVSGISPRVVEIPVGYVHNITNVGEGTLVLLVWVNELFDQNDTDTFFQEM
jgi:UDP-2-acetamido-2,6-beta-L-arabino-hexul-4-ose reductase